MVKAVKRSLRYVPTCHLTLLEFDSAIKCIASTINNRPLEFNIQESQVLSPNQLLLGRNYDPVHPPNHVVEAPVAVLLTNVRAIVSSWFLRWNNVIISQLLKIPKWSLEHPELQEGDLCLLHQKKGKRSLPVYKYCQVLKVIPSQRDGKVQTVQVKNFNSPLRKAKSTIVDIRNLSSILAK